MDDDVSFPTQNAKRLKLGKDRSPGEGKSRICSLPDSILKHILSFLPIKEAVRTSLLSKRWEFLWASLSKLEFKGYMSKYVDSDGESDYNDDDDGDDDYEEISVEELRLSREKKEKFLNFVEKTLLLHDSSNINTFRLECEVEVPSDGTQPRINSWILAALRQKVEKLILRLSFSRSRGSFVLPRRLFDCDSLNELELEFSCDLRLPSFVYFPNLKILTLSNVIFTDYNSVNRLFSSFPKLEKLDLIRCNWHKVKAVYVSAPMLEHLKIVEGDGYKYRRREVERPDCCQFMISGPRLKIFEYRGELINKYCIVQVPSLVSALIIMYSSDSCGENRAVVEKRVGYRAHKLLGGLSNVKNLHVSLPALEALSVTDELFPCLPLFHNLNQLEVGDWNDWVTSAHRGLLKLLHNTPHLESIYFGRCLSMFSEEGWQLDPVPPCFLTNLKTIKVGEFRECEEDLNALKILLKSARALERIDIGDQNKDYNAIIDLLKECAKSNIVFH